MKRVCFLIGDISRTGGTERVTVVIANALVHCGFDVSIISVSNGLRANFQLDPKVTLFSLHMQSYSANLSDFRILFRLRKILLHRKFNVMIGSDTILSFYIIPAALGTITKVISWEHFHYFINVGDIFQRIRREVGRRMAVMFSDVVVTLTDRDRQQYLKQLTCRSPLISIPNPRTIAHERRSFLNSKVVMAAGRLVSEKGFNLLLAAWALVKPFDMGWRLRIVGSGPDELLLKSQAQALKVLEFVDFIPHSDDIGRQYETASIFVCSSLFEGFGLVLVEAKSFGLPIVSFDCDCGPSAIVRDGIDGVLVPKEDVDCLAISLRSLMDNEQLMQKYGQNAYDDRRFDLENIVPAWEQIILRC
jgi:glycosyltransferase involved in cell wall biosynthesis